MRKKLKRTYKFLRKYIFRPYVKMLLLRMIIFYQRHLSHHTCLYSPTCSEYMKRALNNHGVIIGLLMGIWRLLRCNPLSKGGYDPVPENYFKLRWVV